VTDLRPTSDPSAGGARGRAQAIPAPDADWEEISSYAHLFDGYAHFGDNWAGAAELRELAEQRARFRNRLSYRVTDLAIIADPELTVRPLVRRHQR